MLNLIEALAAENAAQRVELPTHVIRHLTPLTTLQQRLLALAALEDTCYTRLVAHLSKPPQEISER